MKNKEKVKQSQKLRRRVRVRARVFGTAARPRLSVFRSVKHINAQLIDDTAGKTLAAASDLKLGKIAVKEEETRKTSLAHEVGKMLAKAALGKGINDVVFDRGVYRYHGRIKALADGAREGGLKF